MMWLFPFSLPFLHSRAEDSRLYAGYTAGLRLLTCNETIIVIITIIRERIVPVIVITKVIAIMVSIVVITIRIIAIRVICPNLLPPFLCTFIGDAFGKD